MTDETRILYNDTCPLCRFEVDHYRAAATRDGAPLRFDRLEDAARWGLTPDQAARRLHVLRGGELLSGLEAFSAAFHPDRKLLVGGDGIPLESFLERPVESWVMR